MFVKMAGNFYPIYKCGDHFELYGLKQVRPAIHYRSGMPDLRDPMGVNMVNLGVGTAVSSIFNRLDDLAATKIKLYSLDLESGKLINP